MKRYLQLASEFENLIVNGTLEPGVRLPSVRQASSSYRVSPSTVSRAYYTIERRGLLVGRPQSGYFVASRRAPTKSPAITSNRSIDEVDGDILFTPFVKAQRRYAQPGLRSSKPSAQLFPLNRISRSLTAATRRTVGAQNALSAEQANADLRRQNSLIDIARREQLELRLSETGCHKDEFLAMLAHELRNPLAPLRTAIALLDKQPDAGNRSPALIDMMRRQVDHMTRIVDDLLEVSRITQGRIVLQVEPLLMGTAVEHAVEAVTAMVEARHQHLHVNVCNPTTWVNGDIMRISQIFVNILNNACTYTPEHGEITVNVEADEESVSVVTQDTGTGIAAELLPNVFELFSQGERTLDRTSGGLGIGLSLVKKLVELHHGTICVFSDGPNLGTTVTVRLPRLHRHERYAAVEPLEDAPGYAETALRVLVVDDNHDAADSLAMLCASEGHVARVAYSSAEALEAALQFAPDVALLDIGLPDIDGFELANQLRREDGRKPLLIAITGYGQPEDRLRAQAAGFEYHFVKPVNIDGLLKLLASAAAGSSAWLAGRSERFMIRKQCDATFTPAA